jgi:diketogulonate reductase-like aldo/keto reductase
MPIGSTPLNDNRRIPNIAFGTGSAWYRRDVTDAVFTALEVGFRHIDTAQAYGNEKNVGIAIKDWLFDGIETSAVPVDVKPRVDNSEHKRKEIWVTTKYGGGERGPLEELKLSLERVCLLTKYNRFTKFNSQLHLDYVDLYLIHQPRYIDGNVKGVWREFEWAKELGLAK